MRWILLIALGALLWLLLKRSGQPSTNSSTDASAVPPVAGNTGGDSYNPGTPQVAGPLNDIAQAIYQFEGGFKADSLNVRNNNPGNLRSAPGQTGTSGGYATFSNFSDGWGALQGWITSNAQAHPDWDFYDLFAKYAPASDNNDPDAYAEYVANYAGADPTQPVSQFLQGS